MQRTHLLTSALMPNGYGTYISREVNVKKFSRLVKEAADRGQLYTYVRYPQVAEVLSIMCGIRIPTTRDIPKNLLQNELLLIIQCRSNQDKESKYRTYTLPEDYEYRVVEYK